MNRICMRYWHGLVLGVVFPFASLSAQEYELDHVAGGHASDPSCWCGVDDSASTKGLGSSNQFDGLGEKIEAFTNSLPSKQAACSDREGKLTLKATIVTCGSVEGSLGAIVVEDSAKGSDCTSTH